MEDRIAFASGAALTAVRPLLNINWGAEWEEIFVKSVGVLIVGVVGGFAGMFGKYIFDKLFKKDTHVLPKSHQQSKKPD